MNGKTKPGWEKLKTTFVASAFLCAAAPAFAAEITLRTLDGTTTISGELLEFEDGTYTVQSRIGAIKVKASDVECIGDDCPALEPITVEWDVSMWGKRRAFTEHLEKLSELVAEKTEGKFTLTLHYGGLAPARENLEGIAAGDFEMAQFCAGYHPEKNPAVTVMELPFLGVSSLQQETDLSMAIYSHPAVAKDMQDRWKATLLMPSPQPQNNIIGVGFPPTSLEAFVGMQIRAQGGVGRAVEALGAKPVSIPAPDVRGALADGTIEAVAFAPHAHMAFGTIESGSWWTTNLNPGTSNCPVVMNTEAFENLPDMHREALMSSVGPALEYYVDNYNQVTLGAWGPALQERGVVEITINDEIRSDIDERVAGPAARAWIEEKTAQGLPAQELYDLLVGMIAETN